jgi:hypothetical protein
LNRFFLVIEAGAGFRNVCWVCAGVSVLAMLLLAARRGAAEKASTS